MFNSISAFKSTTKSLHTALKSNPKLKVGQIRELICQSTPFGSMAAYEASFEQGGSAIVANTNVKFSVEQPIEHHFEQKAFQTLTFEETMHNEFNRLAHTAMSDYMGEISYHDVAYALNNYTGKRINENVPNLYHLILTNNKELFNEELRHFHLKETTHNMGVLMYSLPPEILNDTKSECHSLANWNDVLNQAFFNKLRKSLFTILEIIEIEYLNSKKMISTQEFFNAFITIANNHSFQKNIAVHTEWEEVGSDNGYALVEKMKAEPLTKDSLIKLLEQNEEIIEAMDQYWEETSGQDDWEDNNIVLVLEEHFMFDLTPSHELFPVVRDFFNQTMNFFLVGYESEDKFNNASGHSGDSGTDISGTYNFISEARKAMVDADFDDYELIWLRSSNGEESETYNYEEYKAYKTKK